MQTVQCGAALASQGYIPQVKKLWLHDLDISLVQASDLSSLLKCVTGTVCINRVTGDVAPVISSVQCRLLEIYNTMLSTADTQQLVAAMVTRVEWVNLVDVTLDMEKLAQYDGEGECGSVMLRGEAIT